jgi:uncharacterized protein YfiM (DUF2279 family)
MLSNTLNTNEIKNAAGTEVEFQRLSTDGRKTEFGLITETPALLYRLLIAHQETGNGLKRRRRSMVRFNKTVVSTVDLVTPVTISFVQYLDAPVGALAASTEMSNVIANGLSFSASLGASTTILYDCTGNGAATMLSGGL